MTEIANLTDTTANLSLTDGEEASICAAIPRSSNGKTTDSDSVAQPQQNLIVRNSDGVCSPRQTADHSDECELKYAGNGLFYVISPNGFRYLEYFPEAYQMWIDKEGIRAGNGLDKSEWPKTPRPSDYTYFARGTESGRIKIGRSKHPKTRMAMLSHERRERVELLATTPDGDLEWYYLNAFADHRLEGEWFAPHPAIMAEITYLKDQML